MYVLLEPVIVTSAVPSTAPSAPVPQNLDIPCIFQFCNMKFVPSYCTTTGLPEAIDPVGGLEPSGIFILFTHGQKSTVQGHVFAVVALNDSSCPVV